ncbi:MAG: copper chaperone PCu(A)C [Magnetospirillum sp. WYHS-4]
MTPFRTALLAAAFATLALPALAGSITVEEPWARASAGMAKAGAAFLTLRNDGDAPDRLVGAKSDASAKVELHTHKNVDGVMMMRPVEAILVPGKGSAMLKPGGDHVMFMGLNKPLVEGQSVSVTLVFEKAGEVKVAIPVKAAGAMGAMPKGAMDHSKH